MVALFCLSAKSFSFFGSVNSQFACRIASMNPVLTSSSPSVVIAQLPNTQYTRLLLVPLRIRFYSLQLIRCHLFFVFLLFLKPQLYNRHERKPITSTCLHVFGLVAVHRQANTEARHFRRYNSNSSFISFFLKKKGKKRQLQTLKKKKRPLF